MTGGIETEGGEVIRVKPMSELQAFKKWAKERDWHSKALRGYLYDLRLTQNPYTEVVIRRNTRTDVIAAARAVIRALEGL